MAGDIFTLDADNNAAVRTVSVNAGASETNSPVIFTTDENGNAAVRVVGAGGGGSVDYTKVVSKTKTMPVAGADNANMIYLYEGVTNAGYTHGYIYENIKTATYTGTVSFEAASLSGTTVTCSGDDFANFLTESGVEPLSVVSGTITYDAAGNLWVLVGKNANDETVLSFQEYQEDYEDFGFTFTGTPQDGDVIAFTCTVEEASSSYTWQRIDVQPQPKSTQVVSTLTVAGWSNNEQTISVQGVTATNTIFVAPTPTSASDYSAAEILCVGQAANSLTFTCGTTPSNAISVNVVILD